MGGGTRKNSKKLKAVGTSDSSSNDDEKRDAKVAELLGVEESEWQKLRFKLGEIGEEVQKRLTTLILDGLKGIGDRLF